jgi:nitrogen-specific signal transduction histidine kinase
MGLVRFRDAFERSPAGLAILRAGDAIEEINAAAARHFARSPAELRGCRLGDYLTPASRGPLADALAAVRGGASVQRVEIEIAGRSAPNIVVLQVARLPHVTWGVVVTFEDVSAEHARTRPEERLGVLLHALKNPLAPIRMSVSVLQRLGLPSEMAREAVEIIGRSSDRLLRLLDDLLDDRASARELTSASSSRTAGPRSET